MDGLCAGIWRCGYWSDGPLRFREDPWPWHSRGDRGHSHRGQPYVTESGTPQAAVVGYIDRHGWSLWRGGTDHHDWRSDRLAVCPTFSHEFGGTKDAPGCGGVRWHDGDIRIAY